MSGILSSVFLSLHHLVRKIEIQNQIRIQCTPNSMRGCYTCLDSSEREQLKCHRGGFVAVTLIKGRGLFQGRDHRIEILGRGEA